MQIAFPMDQIIAWRKEAERKGLDPAAYSNNRVVECIHLLGGPIRKLLDGSFETTGKMAVAPDALGNMHYRWDDQPIIFIDRPLGENPDRQN